ncbi:hypothetical protein VUR80DRAFT_6226 [Thermomyces stellatus]
MRIEQQSGKHIRPFNYQEFKRRIVLEDLAVGQTVPLNRRLDTLESFMVKEPTTSKKLFTPEGTNWEPMPGQLTIVDLSCPCVTAETACSLFNICLSIFLEKGRQKDPALGPPISRVVALDEAHKYMKAEESGAAGTSLTACSPQSAFSDTSACGS